MPCSCVSPAYWRPFAAVLRCCATTKAPIIAATAIAFLSGFCRDPQPQAAGGSVRGGLGSVHHQLLRDGSVPRAEPAAVQADGGRVRRVRARDGGGSGPSVVPHWLSVVVVISPGRFLTVFASSVGRFERPLRRDKVWMRFFVFSCSGGFGHVAEGGFCISVCPVLFSSAWSCVLISCVAFVVKAS